MRLLLQLSFYKSERRGIWYNIKMLCIILSQHALLLQAYKYILGQRIQCTGIV